MEYLARKINRAKWTPKPFMGPEDIAADAITVCLKTSGNTLSLWECNADITDVHRIALALTLQTDADKVETMDVILLHRDVLETTGFMLNPSPGSTKIDELKDRHIDIIELTLAKLSEVAYLIKDVLKQGANVHRFTRGQLLTLLVDSINEGMIGEDDLGEDLRAAVERKRAGG